MELEYTSNDFYHDIIESMVIALEARDLYTGGHSTRVGDLTYKLCTYLGLSDEKKEMIHIAAHLHDIGKIGIPDSILNKQGKLSAEEWEIMKTHSEVGYNILNRSKSLKEISYIVRAHHERWDGKGYPDGIKEEDIPLGARIIAICDSIDAMRTPRPYRNELEDEVCIAEIKKNKGIMYDPKIVECILEYWDEIYSNSKISYDKVSKY